MPRRRRSPTPNYDTFDEDFDDEGSSNGSRNPPIQRNAANARERARMRVLSSAFCRLKTKLPNIPPDTKLSKLDTLRLATIYIQQLKSLLEGESMNDTSALTFHTSNTQNLAYTWPFTFQKLNSNMHQHHHVSTTTTNNYGNGWSSPSPSSSLPKYHDKFYDNETNYMYDNNNGYTINTRM